MSRKVDGSHLVADTRQGKLVAPVVTFVSLCKELLVVKVHCHWWINPEVWGKKSWQCSIWCSFTVL